MKNNILITAPYMIKDYNKLKHNFDGYNVVIPNIDERMNEQQLFDIYKEYDFIGTICGDDEYTEKVLDSVRGLEVIHKWGTGIDSINKEYAESKDIKVFNTTNAFTIPVSETTIGLILSLTRGIHINNKNMDKNEWVKVPCKTMDEMTIGVMGFGNIGKRVSFILKQMGANVIINDIKYKKGGSLFDKGFEFDVVSLDELLMVSDVITIHCDLNDTSFHLIDKSKLNLMKKTSFLINTARGDIIKEDDLIESLKNGVICGCGLDVYENEPLPNSSDLLEMDNVIKLSHNSNNSEKYWNIIHKNTIKKLLDNV